MNPYTYTVSLRFRHSSMDPQVISDELGVDAKKMWSVTDRPSQGSYWTRNITESENWLSSDDIELDEFIEKFTEEYSKHRDFFTRIKEEDGSIELFIGFGVERNCGLTIDYQLSKNLAILGVDLAFDIYPPDKNKSEPAG